MSDDTPVEDEPRTPEQRITALEQLVAPMFHAWAAQGQDDEAVPPAGTAGAVAESSEEDHGGPWCWTKVDDERRQALAAELTDFVAFLTTRYLQHLSAERYPLAPRWFEQPVAVEILTGVMVAYQAVYTDYRTEPSRELADWHEHILWPALERMKELDLFKDGRLKLRTHAINLDPDARAFLAGELDCDDDLPVRQSQTPAEQHAPIAVDLHNAPTGPILLP